MASALFIDSWWIKQLQKMMSRGMFYLMFPVILLCSIMNSYFPELIESAKSPGKEGPVSKGHSSEERFVTKR